jgi:hypothetical protein
MVPRTQNPALNTDPSSEVWGRGSVALGWHPGQSTNPAIDVAIEEDLLQRGNPAGARGVCRDL